MEKFTLNELANYINMTYIPNSWKECYSNSLANLLNIKWLKKNYIKKAIKVYKLNDEKEYVQEIFKAIKIIKNNDKLRILANLFHYILFKDRTNQINDVWNWGYSENLFNVMGNNLLPLIVLLSGYKLHIANMKNKKFDNTEKQDSITSVHNACLKDKNFLGLCGIRFSQMVWGAYFINIKLIKIGCLEYEPFLPDSVFAEKIKNLSKKFYRDKETYLFNNNNVFCKIHIPVKTDLTQKTILNSLQFASKTLQKYFNYMQGKKIIFFCESWLLSPDLEKFLKKDSNIIAFKNLFNICPDYNNGKGYFKYLFNQTDIIEDIRNLPENTSLQKNVKCYLEKGRVLRDGYGIIKDEILEKL